jgi:predicted short-subunit dehydrogenase-like oxidoreductase (DUF2520 family)
MKTKQFHPVTKKHIAGELFALAGHARIAYHIRNTTNGNSIIAYLYAQEIWELFNDENPHKITSG